MPSQPNTLYQSLSKDQILGPEHRRFKLDTLLGKHLLGQLWSATDLSHANAPVAVVVISPELMADKGFQEALKKQVIIARKLTHPHLLKALGFFIHRAGLLLLATEPVDGLTLQGMIEKKHVKKLKPSQQRGLLMQVAASIDHYHEKTRLPYGSLAPDQIFINRQGGVKVWPLSNKVLLEASNSALTGDYIAYQSEENFHPNLLPINSDTYAVATIAYTVLSGKSPFTQAQGPDSRLSASWKAPQGLEPPQWDALLTGLDNDSAQRPESSAELISAIYAETDKPEQPEAASDDPEPNEPPLVNTKATSKQTNDNTPKKSRSVLPSFRFHWIKGAGLFTAGLLLGLSLSLWFFLQQQQLNQQINAWKEQAFALKESAQANALVNENLQQQLNQLQQKPTPLDTAQPPKARDAAEADANFAHFQDQLSTGVYGPEMVSLPAGRFFMGDQHGLGDDNERPVIEVVIDKPFALARHEVTFAEYDRFATATNRTMPDDNGWGRDNQPVVNVSWLDATAYAAWLSKETGQNYRLPSEAEWEYAARAGTNTAYWWGDELYPNRAVCDGCGTQWDAQQPAPVGSLPANPWGLLDMNGNVDEWVQDCYLENYQNYPKDGSAYSEPRCAYRSMRGGSWFDIDRVVRSASRYRHPADTSRNAWGFRVALDL